MNTQNLKKSRRNSPMTSSEDSVVDRSAMAAREIFGKAMALFEKNGFRRTSMNEVAEACGVTKPTLYYYFRNKSHLLEILYEDITKEFFSQVGELSEAKGSAAQRLHQLITLQVTYNIAHRSFLSIFWRERHELDMAARKSLAGMERGFEKMVEAIINDGKADGTLNECDTQTVTYSILGLLSTVHRWSVYVDRKPDEIANEMANLVLRGLVKS